MPSRFIEEIPEHLLKWLQPKHQNLSNTDFNRGWRTTQNQLGGASNLNHSVSSMSKQTTWQIGRSVSHGTFGVGVIVNCEGQGKDLRVQVRFSRAGTKWLLLEYANLTLL